ncbi:hypothetical protein EDB83DRAFT_2430474 [Lactarius deliciosus]|nr:hypothetical protein EDB83DRAFT_2430474 [Lactarius deliciosus]
MRNAFCAAAAPCMALVTTAKSMKHLFYMSGLFRVPTLMHRKDGTAVGLFFLVRPSRVSLGRVGPLGSALHLMCGPFPYIRCPLPIIVSYSHSFSPCSLTLATVTMISRSRTAFHFLLCGLYSPSIACSSSLILQTICTPLFFCPGHSCLGLCSPRPAALALCPLPRTRA